MLNIASVNNGQDQTRSQSADIKSKSPAEVTDIFNVSKRQVERIQSATKWLATFMTDPGQADRGRQLAQVDSLLVRLSNARPMSTVSQLQEESRTVRWILVRNGLHGHIALNKTAKKPCCVCQGSQPDGRLDSRKVLKNWFQINHQLSSIPSTANIVDDPQGPVWTHGSPRRQSNLEVERLWFGVTSNTEVQGRSVRWMVTLIVPNINRSCQYIPKYKKGRIFPQDGAPCHTSGSSMKFLRGKKIKVLHGWPAQSPDINIIEHIRGKWRRKLGGPSRRTWRSFGMPARWPSMPSPMTSSTSFMTLASGSSKFCESDYLANNNALASEPWLIDENVAPAFVTKQIIGGCGCAMLRIRRHRIPKPQPGPSDDPDGCITTPMVKVLKAILACLLETTIESQLKRKCLGLRIRSSEPNAAELYRRHSTFMTNWWAKLRHHGCRPCSPRRSKCLVWNQTP